MKVSLVFLQLLLLSLIESHQHLNANGPFGKQHNIKNEPSPNACNRDIGVATRFFRRRFRTVEQMNVSKTFYTSSEPIQVSWTPVTQSCKDDFVGVFYAEVNFIQNGTTTTTDKASDMCEAQATVVGPKNFIDPGYMHTMLLKDLRLSTTYYYRVGIDEHGWSNVYSFTNRPASKEDSIYMIAYGDMGLAPVEPGAKSTIERVIARVLIAHR